MGNRTEYILSSMSAPKFDTSAFSNASNQFGNALNVGVRQMDELNKGKSLAYANDYVSSLLGKGDRTSVLAAQGMLPYANERYGKQAENLMGDIRHSEQMKQARDLFDITNKLEKDKLAEDIRVHSLTNNYQMGSLGLQKQQMLNDAEYKRKALQAQKDQYTAQLLAAQNAPRQFAITDNSGHVTSITMTPKSAQEYMSKNPGFKISLQSDVDATNKNNGTVSNIAAQNASFYKTFNDKEVFSKKSYDDINKAITGKNFFGPDVNKLKAKDIIDKASLLLSDPNNQAARDLYSRATSPESRGKVLLDLAGMQSVQPNSKLDSAMNTIGRFGYSMSSFLPYGLIPDQWAHDIYHISNKPKAAYDNLRNNGNK